MSATPEQESMFADAPVPKLKPFYSVGVISELSELTLTKPKEGKTQWLMLPFKLRPLASGQSARGQLLFRPEWFVKGFDPSTEFGGEDPSPAESAALRVYQSNIKAPRARAGSEQPIATLAGLAGTPERFNQLAIAILNNPVKVTEAGYINALNKIFHDFLFPGGAPAKTAQGDDVVVGYKLVQNKEKNEETGKYEDRAGYQLGEFFYPTDEKCEKLKEAAEESGKFKVGW